MCLLLIIATLQHQTQSSTGNKHWLTWLGLLRIAVRLKCVDCWTVPTLAPQRSCPLALWASRGRSVADILQKMSRVRIIWSNPRSEVIATVRAFEMTRMSLKEYSGFKFNLIDSICVIILNWMLKIITSFNLNRLVTLEVNETNSWMLKCFPTAQPHDINNTSRF